MYPIAHQQSNGVRQSFSFSPRNGGRIETMPGPVVSRHAQRNPFFYLMRLRARIQYRELVNRMETPG